MSVIEFSQAKKETEMTQKERQERRKEEAKKIAQRLFGVYDSNGMLTQGVYGTPGLARLANAYIKKEYSYTNWKVGETAPNFADEDYIDRFQNSAHFGDSHYYIKSL